MSTQDPATCRFEGEHPTEVQWRRTTPVSFSEPQSTHFRFLDAAAGGKHSFVWFTALTVELKE